MDLLGSGYLDNPIFIIQLHCIFFFVYFSRPKCEICVYGDLHAIWKDNRWSFTVKNAFT